MQIFQRLTAFLSGSIDVAAACHTTVAGFTSGALVRVSAALSRLGVTPNVLTFLSLAPAAASGVAAASGAFVIAAACLLASGLCDVVDGAMARATGQTSRFGALLDSTMDRLADAAPMIGLVLFYGQWRELALIPALTMIGGYTISYIRARVEGLGGRLPRLWMRREDRLVLVAAALLLGAFDLPGVQVPAPVTLIAVSIIAVLNAVAAVIALWSARNELRT